MTTVPAPVPPSVADAWAEPVVAGADDPAGALAACLERADPARGAAPAAGAAAALQARELALALGRPLDAGRAAAWLCAHQMRQGAFDAADASAQAALPLLADRALLDERCETLRLQALANCERGHFSEALEAAQQLGSLAAEIRSHGWALMAANALAACYDRLGDAWQASRVLEEALAAHGDGATPRQRLIACVGMSACLLDTFHRMRDALPAEQGLERLRRARPYAEAALPLGDGPDPSAFAATRGNLGEVLLFLGEVDAAEPILQAAMRRCRDHGVLAYARRIEATWGQWLLARGRAAEARDLALDLLAQLAEDGSPVTRLRVLDVAYRACRALGRFEEALAHHEAFERQERQRTLSEMQALGQLFVTRGEAMKLARRADEFEHRARHDELTGLANRGALQQRATHLGPGDVLAVIDIDHFKQINDAHGHAAGDAVLVRLAALLGEGIRDSDLAARTGGEEFVLLLGGLGPSAALEVCERLRAVVEQQADWPELPPGQRVTISIGLTAAAGLTLEAATRRADAALYEAKRGGRNRVVVSGA